jgi:CHRD domain-containing protein
MSKLALGVVVLALTLAGLAAAAGTSDTYAYKATLTKGAEVPKPTAPATASGAFTATVVEGATSASLSWTLTFRGLSGKAVGAHIHRGKPGVAGPVIVPLCGPCKSGKKGKATITKAVAEALERGRAYVNVHTTKNAAGEIRGQVKLTRKTEGTATDPPPPPPTDGGGGGEDPPQQPPGY